MVFAQTDWQASLSGKERSSIIVLSIFANGINVSEGELSLSARALHNGLEGVCPVLGFYNQTQGIRSDVVRFCLEAAGIDTPSVIGLRQVLSEAMDYFAGVCPNFRIFLAGHSEGGLIIYNAIEGMDDTHRAMAFRHLIIRTYGAIQFVPSIFGVDVWNISSEKDYAARWARNLITGNTEYGCNVAYVPCISSSKELTVPIIGPDHNFMGPTYQKALDVDMKNLGKTHVFIYSTSR